MYVHMQACKLGRYQMRRLHCAGWGCLGYKLGSDARVCLMLLRRQYYVGDLYELREAVRFIVALVG